VVRRAVLVLSVAACGLSVDGTGVVAPLSGADDGGAPHDGAPDVAGPAADAALPSDGSDGSHGSPWSYRRKLTIDNTAQDALVDFPVLVVLDGSRITYAHCLPGGADVRFTDAGAAPLQYEVEAWQPGGRSYLWVKVPQIASHATTDIWMIYGNPSAADAQAASKVWDAGFVGVWHLASANDSTGKHASTNAGATATDGMIGAALAFDGISQYVDTKAVEQLDEWTIEAWSYAARAPVSGGGWSGPLMRDNYNLQWDCNASSFCRATSVILKPSNWVEASFGALIAQTWYYLAATFDTHTLVSYVDGLSSTSNPIGTNMAADVGVSAKIAADRDATNFFAGKVDEVRISSVVRTGGWILAQQRSMTDRYIAFGAEQPL
jgi:hypothetical protein